MQNKSNNNNEIIGKTTFIADDVKLGNHTFNNENFDTFSIKFPIIKIEPGFVDRLYVNLKRLYLS